LTSAVAAPAPVRDALERLANAAASHSAGPLGRAAILGLPCLAGSCAGRLPALEEVDAAVLMLREYPSSAWALGIVAIWADLVAPIPQTSVITALGIVYGTLLGGLLGSFALVTGGLLGYAVARAFGRGLVARVLGESTLGRAEGFFERAGMWAILLTRSLPYSLPEGLVLVAGLGRMRIGPLVLALTLGSVPTAFVFAALGAGWDTQPALALAASYVIPILLLPIVLFVLRRHAAR
jgi:uncharacterized membrane protein YdjX (TVP38/TMEM64 family)